MQNDENTRGTGSHVKPRTGEESWGRAYFDFSRPDIENQVSSINQQPASVSWFPEPLTVQTASTDVSGFSFLISLWWCRSNNIQRTTTPDRPKGRVRHMCVL